MDKHKIHKIVEHIRSWDEFPFDVEDVEESLPVVLGYFRLHPEVDMEEREALQGELRVLAISSEMGEVTRLVELTADREGYVLLRGLHPYRKESRDSPSVNAGQYVERMCRQ